VPHVAAGIQIFLFVESEPPARRQHPLVVLVGFLRAVARHQVGGGTTDGVGGLDAENAGHIAVHQDVAELLVLDVDDGGHGVDDLLQQPPAFGNRILGALLIGDVAHRSFIADDPAFFVAHDGGAVGEPENRAAALAHLIFELAHHAVARHQRLVFGARRMLLFVGGLGRGKRRQRHRLDGYGHNRLGICDRQQRFDRALALAAKERRQRTLRR